MSQRRAPQARATPLHQTTSVCRLLAAVGHGTDASVRPPGGGHPRGEHHTQVEVAAARYEWALVLRQPPRCCRCHCRLLPRRRLGISSKPGERCWQGCSTNRPVAPLPPSVRVPALFVGLREGFWTVFCTAAKRRRPGASLPCRRRRRLGQMTGPAGTSQHGRTWP